jgi:3-oxoadipate enol-lactonase
MPVCLIGGIVKDIVIDQVAASVVGAGAPLFLFHSLLSDRASFDRIVPELARQFQVVVADLPGFGRSEPFAGGLDAIADRMAGLVRGLAGEGRAIVLGNGYGGFVALQMAIRHPGLARRLLLADCGARFSEPGRQALRNMAAAAASGGLVSISDIAMRRLFAPGFQAANPELVAERRAAFLRTDLATFRQACLILAELDLTGELHKAATPALVLVGDEDEATPPPMSVALIEGLPQARLAILPGCAHVPQLQAPDLFLKAVAGFLAEATGPAE